jgi:peptidyl-tRNA hydrolase, PTH2 family
MGLKQAIIVRKDLKMGTGKIAAQVAHASLAAMRKAGRRDVEEWESEGCKKVVLKVKDMGELESVLSKLRSAKIPNAVIRDAGLTQIEPGEVTCVGVGPIEESKLDAVTRELKLL